MNKDDHALRLIELLAEALRKQSDISASEFDAKLSYIQYSARNMRKVSVDTLE